MSKYSFHYEQSETRSLGVFIIIAEILAVNKNHADTFWINVCFTRKGFDLDQTERNNDERIFKIFQNNAEEIKKVALAGLRKDLVDNLGPLHKENILKSILRAYKEGLKEAPQMYIIMARSLGIDYPEFKVIEKSIESSKLSESEEPNLIVHSFEQFDKNADLFEVELNGHTISVLFHDMGSWYSRFEVITGDEKAEEEWKKYPHKISLGCMSAWILGTPLDKEHILKKILKLVSSGSYSQAATYIKLSRQAGYDFPELKIIEKSIKNQ